MLEEFNSEKRNTFRDIYPAIHLANFNVRLMTAKDAYVQLKNKVYMYPEKLSDLEFARIRYRIDKRKKAILISVTFPGSVREFTYNPDSIDFPKQKYSILEEANEKAEVYLLKKSKEKSSVKQLNLETEVVQPIDTKKILSAREIVRSVRGNLESQMAR